jgi:uncharacterized protein (TIRG00374 family)
MFEKSIAFFQSQATQVSRKKKIAGLILFFILLIIVILVIPWADTWSVILHSDPGKIAIAFLLLLPSQILSAASFRVVGKSQDIPLSTWQVFLINSTINFYEIVLPATFFGSGLRWYRYAQQSKKPAESFAATAYLKIYTLFLALLISFGFLLFFDTTELHDQSLSISLLLAGISLILFLLPNISLWLINHARGLEEKEYRSKLLNLVRKVSFKILRSFADFKKLSTKAQILLIILGISSQMIQFVSFIFFAEAVGINLTYGQLGSIRAVLLLASNLPINLSPGIGLREVSLVALLVAMGVQIEQAAAMSALVFARTLFYGLLGGLIEVYTYLLKKSV